MLTFSPLLQKEIFFSLLNFFVSFEIVVLELVDLVYFELVKNAFF